MSDSTVGQSDAQRAPLYEKAKAVVVAYDSDLAGDFWVDNIDRAIRELREELRSIDDALALRDSLRVPGTRE